MKIVRSLLFVTLAAGSAHADEEARVTSELAREGGWLEIDPMLRSRFETLGATEETQSTRLDLGLGTILDLEGTRWSNEEDIPRPHVDLPGRGWSTALRLSRDLGVVQIAAHASVSEIDTPLARGRHADVGLSITRTFRLSRWMLAWISLGIGRRVWLGQAPPGERGGTEVMLTIGTTFR